MNRYYSSILVLAGTTAAAAALMAVGASQAYAETPTIDTTPFVSTRTRAEVKTEVLGQRQLLSAAGGEWALQSNQAARFQSAYTSGEAKSQYIAARDEVRAMTAEDSGSSYIQRQASRMHSGIIMAGAAR